jgi:hypothetical protein
MAVALRVEIPGMSLDQYDSVIEAMSFPADWLDGLLAHGAAEDESGVVVGDVWESRDKFDAALQSRIGPAMGAVLGDDAPEPNVTETPLHTFFARETR